MSMNSFLNFKFLTSKNSETQKDKHISGSKHSKNILDNLQKDISTFKNKRFQPTLAIVLANDRPDSKSYINMKLKACKKIGIKGSLISLTSDVTDDILLNVIDELNQNSEINGIIVQLPLPENIDVSKIMSAIDPLKDVDGFGDSNLAKLFRRDDKQIFAPCTPLGIIELLDREEIDVSGKFVVIVGCSNIVGRPLGALLLKRDATVSFCHIKTLNIQKITKLADVLIVATGVPALIKKHWINDSGETIVIDVGINRVDDSSKVSGYRLTGDVDYDSVINKVKKITPVPGGVGPMTVALLMKNTVKAYKLQHGLS